MTHSNKPRQKGGHREMGSYHGNTGGNKTKAHGGDTRTREKRRSHKEQRQNDWDSLRRELDVL